MTEIPKSSDVEYFRQPTRPSAQPSENWVLRFSALKRLYRLMTQYFTDVLQKPTGSLDVPDLQAIAKDHNIAATLTICRLTIAIGVQCERNKQFIDKIQDLSEADQHHLMKAIEQVRLSIHRIQHCSTKTLGHGSHHCYSWKPRHWRGQYDRVRSLDQLLRTCILTLILLRDDHYYRIQSERSQIFSEKETLQKVYQALLEEHRTLQTNFDDAVSEKEDALARVREVRREVDSRRNEKADVMMRAEIERLRADLYVIHCHEHPFQLNHRRQAEERRQPCIGRI